MFNKELMLTMFSIGDDMLFPDYSGVLYEADNVASWTPQEDCFVIIRFSNGYLTIGGSLVLPVLAASRTIGLYCLKGHTIACSSTSGVNMDIKAFPLVRGGGLKKNLRRALDV